MGRMIELCCVRQEARVEELNLSNEVITRELESDFQELNSLRGTDLRSSSPNLQVANRSQNPTVRKPFWFLDVEVEEDEDTVIVEFSDGHIEEFDSAQVWSEYSTLDPDQYGPDLGGMYKYSTGTVHLVDTSNNAVCGRFDSLSPTNITSLNTESDDVSYNSFCSQCSHKYDTLITNAADLSVSLDC